LDEPANAEAEPMSLPADNSEWHIWLHYSGMIRLHPHGRMARMLVPQVSLLLQIADWQRAWTVWCIRAADVKCGTPQCRRLVPNPVDLFTRSLHVTTLNVFCSAAAAVCLQVPSCCLRLGCCRRCAANCRSMCRPALQAAHQQQMQQHSSSRQVGATVATAAAAAAAAGCCYSRL
jgi:hypothetical protein